MRNSIGNADVRPTRGTTFRTLLAVAASSLFLMAGLAIASTGSASAAPVVARAASTAPCNATVTGGGEVVPGQQLIVGVVAGTTSIKFDCNTASGADIVAEASLLAAIGSSNVLPNNEADTAALGSFTAAATDTGCPTGTAGSCSTATFSVPTTFSAAGDKNATCPPTQAQINAGIFGCAVVVANAQEAQVAGAEYLIQYASQTTVPAAPTITALQTTGSPGSEINVSDAAGATGYWWGNALQAVQALNDGTVAQTAPSACGTGGGYGDVPSPYLFDTWTITGTSTIVGGGPASGVTISDDCYNGATVIPPALGGTLTVPATVTNGASYTVYLCEVNLTPYPSNDTNAATDCGTKNPVIDASFSFKAAAKVISQNLPVANTVAATASSTFRDQLAASGNNGTVSYAQTAGSPSVVVSGSGAVSTSGALKPGAYTASGTTSDASGDSGTFTYTLTVTGTTPVTTPPPRATRVDGYAVIGRTVVITILGRDFTAGPKIIGHAGSIVTVLGHNASKIIVRVREVASAKKGTYNLIIQFANGKRTSIHYSVR
jgi:hypothetical protein